MDELQFLKDLDTLYAAIKKSNRYMYPNDIVTESQWNGKMSDNNYVITLAARLFKDGYIKASNNDNMYLSTFMFDEGNQDFKGYIKRYEEEQHQQKLERDKLFYETENAKNVHKDYKRTKWFALIAFIISIILLGFEVYKTFFKKETP